MRSSLQGVVVRFKFHQNRLSGFRDVGVEICPFPLLWPLAYATACTTIHAVTTGCKAAENDLFRVVKPSIRYVGILELALRLPPLA